MLPRKSGSQAQSGFANVISGIRSLLTTNLNTLPAKGDVSKLSASVESFDAEVFQALDPIRTGMVSVSTEAFNFADSFDAAGANVSNEGHDLNVGGLSLPTQVTRSQGGLEASTINDGAWMGEAQLNASVEAASTLMMAHNGVRAWYEIEPAKFESDVRMHSMNASGPHGSIPVLPAHAQSASLESFSEEETEKWREFSYSIASIAAKTHPFVEAFYPIYVTTPENGAFIIPIRRNMVWNGFQHLKRDGKTPDAARSRKNIQEALLDHSLLETKTTKLIPVRVTENDSLFVDDSIIENWEDAQDVEKFETNFLKFGDYEVNLINLGQSPSRLAKGPMNFTDSLDRRIALEKLALSIGDEVVLLNVNRDKYAQFWAEREYNFRDMALRFYPERIALNKDLLTYQVDAQGQPVEGTVPALIQPFIAQGYYPTIGFKIDGRVNVEHGGTNIRTTVPVVTAVFDEKGNEIDLEDPIVKPLVTALSTKLKLEGYILEARLTNLNQLELGLLIDSDVQKEGFVIPQLAPITMKKPSLTDTEKTYPKMEALQMAYRTRMRNDGVTALLNRSDEMRRQLGNKVQHKIESNMGMEGLGQYYYRPYYEEIDIDVFAELNSDNSADKYTDIQALLIGRINERLYDINRITGYSAGLESAFPGNTPKAHVALGTDLYLPQFLMRQGDDRTMGIGFDHTIVSISDLRMKDTIICMFTLPGQSEPHPMQSGVCGFIPEFLTNFMMIRDQRVGDEIRLTPRYRYFNIGVIMLKVNVQNMEAAVALRTEKNVNVKTADKFPGKETLGDALVPSYEDPNAPTDPENP